MSERIKHPNPLTMLLGRLFVLLLRRIQPGVYTCGQCDRVMLSSYRYDFGCRHVNDGTPVCRDAESRQRFADLLTYAVPVWVSGTTPEATDA